MKDYLKQKFGRKPSSNIEIQQVRKYLSLQSTKDDSSTQSVSESEDEKTKDVLMSWKEKAREKRLSRIETSLIMESKVGSAERSRDSQT